MVLIRAFLLTLPSQVLRRLKRIKPVYLRSIRYRLIVRIPIIKRLRIKETLTIVKVAKPVLRYLL
jgi:hypothetical protein